MKRLSMREILTLLIATIVLLIALYTAIFNNHEFIKTNFFNTSVGASPIEIITDMITELKEASAENTGAANIAYGITYNIAIDAISGEIIEP